MVEKAEFSNGLPTWDVFISAKNEDIPIAKKIYDFLQSRGVQTFFSAESLPQMGRADYREQIDNAIDSARHMVVVGSTKQYIESRWVKAEWSMFINEIRAGRKDGNLITLVVGGLDIGDLSIALRQYEVIELDEPGALDRLLLYVGARKSARISQEPISSAGQPNQSAKDAMKPHNYDFLPAQDRQLEESRLGSLQGSMDERDDFYESVDEKKIDVAQPVISNEFGKKSSANPENTSDVNIAKQTEITPVDNYDKSKTPIEKITFVEEPPPEKRIDLSFSQTSPDALIQINLPNQEKNGSEIVVIKGKGYNLWTQIRIYVPLMTLILFVGGLSIGVATGGVKLSISNKAQQENQQSTQMAMLTQISPLITATPIIGSVPFVPLASPTSRNFLLPSPTPDSIKSPIMEAGSTRVCVHAMQKGETIFSVLTEDFRRPFLVDNYQYQFCEFKYLYCLDPEKKIEDQGKVLPGTNLLLRMSARKPVKA